MKRAGGNPPSRGSIQHAETSLDRTPYPDGQRADGILPGASACRIRPAHSGRPAGTEHRHGQPGRGCLGQAGCDGCRNQDSGSGRERRRCRGRHAAGVVRYLRGRILRWGRGAHPRLQRRQEERKTAGRTRRGAARSQGHRLVHEARYPGQWRRQRRGCSRHAGRCGDASQALRDNEL